MSERHLTGMDPWTEALPLPVVPSGAAMTTSAARNGRAALLDLTRRSLAAIRSGTMVSVVAVDLENFDELVVASGDATGQIVLSEIGRRLVDRCSSGRDGLCSEGSRYILMHVLPATPGSAQSFLEAIERCLDEPVMVAGTRSSVSACIGVTFSTKKSDDARVLVGAAEVACGRARRVGAGAPVVFDGDARWRIRVEFEQGQALREAMARRELDLRYQPIIDLEVQGLVGLSTELAWQSLGRDPTSQHALYRCAERHRLLLQLGDLLLDEFVTQWRAHGACANPSPSATIRATGEQLASWLTRSSERLERARAAVPGRLSIEIVDGYDGRGTGEDETLAWLRRLDIGVVLDGIGDRSLLTVLRTGSVDGLRLHGALVDRVHQGTEERKAVGTLIALAHDFDTAVVADGVRDQAQIDALAELGCDRVHGYFLPGSLPLADAIASLTDRPPLSSDLAAPTR